MPFSRPLKPEPQCEVMDFTGINEVLFSLISAITHGHGKAEGSALRGEPPR
jgi:hypothetical protein